MRRVRVEARGAEDHHMVVNWWRTGALSWKALSTRDSSRQTAGAAASRTVDADGCEPSSPGRARMASNNTRLGQPLPSATSRTGVRNARAIVGAQVGLTRLRHVVLK